MDPTPFRPMLSKNYDVLCCYDYSDNHQEIEIQRLAEEYNRIQLISWSMGVSYGQRQFVQNAHHFEKLIAVNGTLFPVNEIFGIPPEVCRATLEALNEETVIKFYRRMCRSSSILASFLVNRPQRSITDIKNELSVIISGQEQETNEDSIYTDVIISENDMVVPAKNQTCFWETRKEAKVKKMQSGHFPFYHWKNWDDLLSFTD